MSSTNGWGLIAAAVDGLIQHGAQFSEVDLHATELGHVLESKAEFGALFKDADTLIAINIPRGHASHTTCTGRRFFVTEKLPYRSSVLRESGFARFSRLLDDAMYQKRMVRRLTAAGERIPQGIKYILDLGPSEDENSRAEQLEALSLPKGIIRWYLMTKSQLGVPYASAGGHDDRCSCNRGSISPSLPPADELGPEQRFATTTDGGSQLCFWDMDIQLEYRDIDDYCEIRHAANVIRLLRAMAGKAPLLLNSAARVYTIAGLAKIFEIEASGKFVDTLCSAVCEWFLIQPNCQIIEILPEESLKIAWNLKIPLIARTAYRILVSEKAIQNAADSPVQSPKVSVFGRILGDVDEDVQTIIQHASQSFSDRVRSTVQALETDCALDSLQMGEWGAFRMLGARVVECSSFLSRLIPLRNAYYKVAKTCVEAFRAHIITAKLGAPSPEHSTKAHMGMRLYVPEKNLRLTYDAKYSNFNANQKVLTAAFWYTLASTELWAFKPSQYGPHTDIEQAVSDLELLWREAGNNQLFSDVPISNFAWPAQELWNMISNRRCAFDLGTFHAELTIAMKTLCSGAYDPINFEPQHELELNLFRSSHLLLGLSWTEFRLLPLWAGGDNDGSGGVFQDEIPEAQLGPTGPGPAYHTGYTIAPDEQDPDDIGFDKLSIAGTSTIAPSNVVQDGYSTVYDRCRVITQDQSIESEMFSTNNDSDFHEAIRQSREQALYEEFLREDRQREETLNRTGILIDIEEDEQEQQAADESDDDVQSEASTVTSYSDFSSLI